MSKEGANVVISSRKTTNVEHAVNQLKAEGLEVHGVTCHVSNSNHRKQLFDETMEKYGAIDILFSNAGLNISFEPVLQCSEEKWDKIFDVNLKASFLLAKEVVPFMRVRGTGGSIIFMSTIAGFQSSTFPFLGAYSVSKTALLGLTKAASLELASEGIRVNCVAPGIITTSFGSILYNTEKQKQASMDITPMRRFGEPHEVSSVVAFLASDEASFITGENIAIAGGVASRL